MAFTLALAQCGNPQDGSVLTQVETFAAQARQAGAQMLVFPENLMTPHRLTPSELCAQAEPLEGSFAQGVATIARTYGLWVVFTMNERNPSGGQPYNTAVIADDAGALRASYRKCHLYDAHSVRESDRMSRGEALFSPLATPFAMLGLGICYDLRFPELARIAALQGCDLLLYPSAWYDGPHKREHWKTLLRARAIENECYVAGVCRAGRHLVGTSLVVGPLGEVLAEGPDATQEALVTATIDLETIAAARDAMPCLDHRRPELYGTF